VQGQGGGQTSNVAVEVKAPVKVNVEDKVDVAGSAWSAFVLDTSSVAQAASPGIPGATLRHAPAASPLGHRPLEAATRLPRSARAATGEHATSQNQAP
jgi:hypothetical protein